ncbi:MAG TPA: hypothetical protein VHN80_06655, partial [Kineosporiaceae bacterium]|nr:hypothetical protein [Kineosporiaceae bacterium]
MRGARHETGHSRGAADRSGESPGEQSLFGPDAAGSAHASRLPDAAGSRRASRSRDAAGSRRASRSPDASGPGVPRRRHRGLIRAAWLLAVVLVLTGVVGVAAALRLKGNIQAVDVTRKLGTDRPAAAPTDPAGDRPGRSGQRRA